MPNIKVKVLDERLLDQLPHYATTGSAGIDLKACVNDPLTILPGETILVPTGVSIFLEDAGLVGVIAPRSGLGHKHGIVLGNLVGIIDSDYTGQIMISVWNRSDKEYTIQPLERIAQYLILPVIQASFEVVQEFESTQRGAGGFGSTGTK